jgi:parvulin-like peptidyl-prolyl isomerase
MATRRVAVATGILVVAFGLALVAFKGFDRSSAAAQTNPPSTIATVEGRPISAKLFKMYLKNDLDSLAIDQRTSEGRAKIEQLKEGIVSDLIDRALIEAECLRRHLTASEAAFDEAHQKAIGEFGGERAYRHYLAENGLTDQEFKQTTRQNVYGELLQTELNKTVSVSDADIEDFYNKEAHNPAFEKLFNRPEHVSAKHILIAARRSQMSSDIQSKERLSKSEVTRKAAEQIAARRRRAETVLARARKGADFSRLAKEYSEDFATRDRGGDLGSFTRNTHTTPFDEWAFSLKAGEISGLVETEYGFHIIKVTAHSPAHLLSLAEARPAIRERMLARKQAENLRAWLEARRRDADIQIDPGYRFGQDQAVSSKGNSQ